MSKLRIIVSALSLSAAGLLGIAMRENYTETAVVPTQGDRPTVGFGSTFHADGTPVRMGDRTDPVRALRTVSAHLQPEEQKFRESLPGVALTQGEYDLYIDFVYQYGIGNWFTSTMRRNLIAATEARHPDAKAFFYREACDALLRYRFAAGYDCSTLVNGEPNKRCWGVWDSQQKRHAKCLAEQVAQ